jgi:acetyl esterase/lipase
MSFRRICLLVGVMGWFGPISVGRASDPQIVMLHDVVTGSGGGRPLHADIAYPVTGSPSLTAAVVYVHGGGWIGGSHHAAPLAELAKAGYFAASLEYRLDSEATWPAQIQDCKCGVRWLRANAAKYHVDPNRIGAWGDSAGGHLVDCLGTMADVAAVEGDGGFPGVSSAVQAVVSFYGPTDFLDSGKYTDVAMHLTEGLFGVAQADNPLLWRSGSPLYFVKAGDPPFLLVHGEEDGLVPLAQSQVFDAALAQAGVPHQLIVVKNADHGFRPLPGKVIDPSPPQIQQAVFAFFAKYLAPR